MKNYPVPIKKNNVAQSEQETVSTIVFFSSTKDDAMAVLRILGPADAIGLKVVNGVEDGSVHFDRISEGDLIVLQRDFPRDLDAYEKIIALARAENKPVIMDLDDLLFELPSDHPDRITHEFTESLLPMLQTVIEADLVIVATPALHDYLQPYNSNIVVFPNYLNDSLWNLRKPENNEMQSELITIGYMGGHSHKPDLLLILPVLKSILTKYPQKIKFHFWGIQPPPDLVEFSLVDWCPPNSYSYTDFASYFQTQYADIMIAPLSDNLFNSCKSAIKYLEYSSLGIPGVYSRITPYSSVIEDGVDGLLAYSEQEWEDSLSKIIEDQGLRRSIAFNAQKKIKKHWLLSKNAYKLKKLYDSVEKNYLDRDLRLSHFSGTLKSITRQISDYNDDKKQTIIEHLARINALQDQLKDLRDQLSDQKDQLNNHINELEEEVLSYALSTSWQITRPFRKISAKLKRDR